MVSFFASLTVLVYVWSFLVPLESRFLAIFRPRSRHTSTILPLDVWQLPLQELKHCYGFNDFDVDYSVATFNESTLKETCYLFEPTSPAAVQEERRLIAAASRCVLLHGLYELWANADNIQTAVETCAHTAAQLKKDAYYAVAAGVVGNPYITNEDLQRTVLSHFDPLFTSPDNVADAVSLDSDNDKDNENICTEMSTIAQASRSGPSSVPIPVRIYVDELTGRCIVGRLLATGTVTHHYHPL